MDRCFLQEKVQAICEQLESKGENSFFISINTSTGTASCNGSKFGTKFLMKRLHIIEEFYKFCKSESLTDVVNKKENNLNCIKFSTINKYMQTDLHGFKDVQNKAEIDKQGCSNIESVNSVVLHNMHNYSIESGHNAESESENIAGHHLRTVETVCGDNGINKDILGLGGPLNIVNDGICDYECLTESFDGNDDSCSSSLQHDIAATMHLSIRQSEKTSVNLTKVGHDKTSISLTEIGQDETSIKLAKISQDDKKINHTKVNQEETSVKLAKDKSVSTCKVSNDEMDDAILNPNSLDMIDSSQENAFIDMNINMNNLVNNDDPVKTSTKIQYDVFVKKDFQKEHFGGKYSLRKEKTDIIQRLMKKTEKKRKLLVSDDGNGNIQRGKNKTFEKLSKIRGKIEENLVDQNMNNCGICEMKPLKCKCQKGKKRIERKNFVTCAECNEEFSNLRGLRVHLCYTHNKRNVFKCSNCHEVITSERKLRRHYAICKDKILNLDSDEDGHKCPFCFEDFQSDSDLQTHLMLHKPDASLICNVCGKVFESNYKLRKHKINHTVRGLPYKCSKCPKVFATSPQLQAHLRNYHKIKNYVCNICSLLFLSQEVMIEHRKTHVENTCKKCHKIFLDEDEFTKHMKTHEVLKGSGYKCEVCGKLLKGLTSLQFHLQRHSVITPYHCDQCDAKFTNKDTLRRHKYRTHSNKHVMCDLCGKLYNCKETLDHHKNTIHDGKKITYLCKFCDRKFRTLIGHHQHTLDAHCTPENVSENVDFKVHKCKYCTKMFATKDIWEYHMNAHKGNKPYKCTLCSAEYSNKYILRKHKLTHEERKHKCIVCNYGFIDISKYKQHLTSQKHKFNMEKAKLDNNTAKPAVVEQEKVDKTKEKRILGKKGYKSHIPSDAMIKRVKNESVAEEMVKSDEYCNEIQNVSEINHEGETAQVENGTSVSVKDSGTEFMKNSLLVVVTNDQESNAIGDYILQEYEVVENEAVHYYYPGTSTENGI